jgi:hypothetical protein
MAQSAKRSTISCYYLLTNTLYGELGADTFVRHKSIFWPNDPDVFVDYSSSHGDSTDTDWHW